MVDAAVLDRRKSNIMKSPKRGGSGLDDSLPYLKALGVQITEKKQDIQFTSNSDECVHRWAPYVQGFSSSFVQAEFDKYAGIYGAPKVADPFAGCGTVLVQAKRNAYESLGVELNPLLREIADVKVNSWTVRPLHFLREFERLRTDMLASEPPFLKSERHFKPGVLTNLKRLKGGIDYYLPHTDEQKLIKRLFNVAFAAILTDCSQMKRTPCLGYWKDKKVEDDAPFSLFNKKVLEIADDLVWLRSQCRQNLEVRSEVVCANSMTYEYQKKLDLVITSPPYMNGLDYVMNYKIEMAWLGFVSSHEEAKAIKDDMVVCDNVSKGMIREFSASDFYANDWLEVIGDTIAANIAIRSAYRRLDMPFIVRKYFDDMNRVMARVACALNPGGRFILVVGDSLIADTYVPTDLILARIGAEHGLSIESIELARNRRSGQIRDYRLRETVITLRK